MECNALIASTLLACSTATSGFAISNNGDWFPPLLAQTKNSEILRRAAKREPRAMPQISENLRALIVIATMIAFPRAHSTTSCGDKIGSVTLGPLERSSDGNWSCSSAWQPR